MGINVKASTFIEDIERAIGATPEQIAESMAGGIKHNAEAELKAYGKMQAKYADKELNGFQKGFLDVLKNSSEDSAKLANDLAQHTDKVQWIKERWDKSGPIGKAGTIGSAVGAYFVPRNAEGTLNAGLGAKRIGAYMGANIALRYMRGGTISRNPNGDRDIAGIPFI